MKKILLLAIFLLLLPPVGAIVEEDWGNYTRADITDNSGDNVTLNWLRKSYTNENENYMVTVRDFDSQGIVVLDVVFKGRQETVMLNGEWDASRTKIVFAEPVELFNRTLIITPVRIVPPAGVFICCPEAEININVLRPKLNLEFNEDIRWVNSSYLVVNPFANWSYSQFMDIYDNSTETINTTGSERPDNSYRMYEEIPVVITVTNEGDAETTTTAVYLDTDGLIFESGKPYNQLPTLVGTEQSNMIGPTNQTLDMKLKFPSPPRKLNYILHAYVKGIKGGTTYYNDASKTITLLPSLGVRKSVTEESMLLSRKDVESAYPSIDSEDISRWLSGGDIFVSLGVTNYQNYEIKGVRLSDALNREFLMENASLNWTFNLRPYETREFKYTLKAARPGKFNLPPAMLTYSELNMSWGLLSNTPTAEVHGPCIQIFKKPDKSVVARGENTTITLTIRNSGDMPSKVKVMDALAENVTFLGGSMYYDGSLLPKDSAVITYGISLNEYGQTVLPYPRVYVNGNDYSGCGEPITSRILVKEPSIPGPSETIVIPTGTPMPTPILPSKQYGWVEGVFPVFMLALAVAVLIILHRTSK